MKSFFLFAALTVLLAFHAKSQQSEFTSDTIRTVLENNKVKVTEYISNPGKDVCGKGTHSHAPHLSIVFTDAKVAVTTPNGKTQSFDVKAGTAFWSEAETHIAINSGSSVVKAYIVEVK
jgi:hypothetical protein